MNIENRLFPDDPNSECMSFYRERIENLEKRLNHMEKHIISQNKALMLLKKRDLFLNKNKKCKNVQSHK